MSDDPMFDDHREVTPDTVATLPTVDLMGLRIHAVSEAECVACIVRAAKNGRGGSVVTVNLDHLRRVVQQPGYRRLCSEATLCVADGMPLVWASRVRGTPLPERVAGSNLLTSLSAAAALAKVSVFLLGGNPGTADGAAAVLQRRHPGLEVAGTSCPEPGFESDPRRLEALEQSLRRCSPGIVFVALGSPKQELLIDRMRHSLPTAWWLGVGISFSFLTGQVHRAPRWLQAAGLEWLHRLSQEPRRLARRYLVDGLPFAIRLFVDSARRRRGDPRGSQPAGSRAG